MYNPLASQRQQSLNAIAAQRQGVLGNLASQRQQVFAGVRGDNPGPQIIPYSPEMKAKMAQLDAQAAADPQRAWQIMRYKQELEATEASKAQDELRARLGGGGHSSQDLESMRGLLEIKYGDGAVAPPQTMQGPLPGRDMNQMRQRAGAAYSARMPMSMRNRGTV